MTKLTKAAALPTRRPEDATSRPGETASGLPPQTPGSMGEKIHLLISEYLKTKNAKAGA